MGLLSYLFKNKESVRLVELLWVDKLQASVNELSHLSGLSYSTTHEELQRMKSLGLVKMERSGKATLFSSALADNEADVLVSLFATKKKAGVRKTFSFDDFKMPLLGDYSELQSEKMEVEELLVKAVHLSKKNASLLRALPLLLRKMGDNFDFNQLAYWSKRYETNRELGFLLELTAQLTKNKKYNKLAKKFKDKRWAKPDFYFESDFELAGFQAIAVDRNTPELAKKWYLKLNMGLDSFQSFYSKYEEVYN
jgi:hypothetical protein